MHATESTSTESGSRNVPRSPAGCAQLLELWVHGRCVLEQSTVDACLLRLSGLDSDVEYKYKQLYGV